MKKRFWSILTILFLLLALPLMLFLVKNAQRYLLEALGDKANIVIAVGTSFGPLPRIWEGLAQGGEETNPETLKPAEKEIAALSPRYIRLDHIFDFYGVVKRESDGRLTYNFEKLDQLVESILRTGAKPLFSLSYMPPEISSGDVTAPPIFWTDWQALVKRTIEHYSGKSEKNLTDLYYEVWNEPDLFGNWKIGGQPDYRLLYQYAVFGANEAQNVHPFKIGGPSTTGAYRAWLDKFLEFVAAENLRLDFFSWHRYSSNPEKFLEDINFVDDWLSRHGGFYLLPKFLTEGGSTAENSSWHDTNFDAAHLIATIRKLLGRVDLIFTFEIKDGPPPQGQSAFWGRWGLLTHESQGLVKKPKYYALNFLNQLQGEQIKVEGEGTWVLALATRQENIFKIILVNYDPWEKHTENVPLTFLGLEDGQYLLKQTFLDGKRSQISEAVSGGTLVKNFYLSPNSVIFLELQKI